MAMNSTYRALTRAGFNATNFPRLQDVLFITEAEAAALYVARHYSEEKDHEFLKVCPLCCSPILVLTITPGKPIFRAR